MDTKLKGDLAEQAAVLEGLKRGWGVLRPLDFDFALIYVEDVNVFYILPSEMFISYGSGVHLVEAEKRQRKPRSADYRDAWNLISQWAAQEETLVRTPVKFGEASGGVIPSQAPMESEKV